MSKFKALFVERKKNSQILNYSEITKNDLPYADTLVRISFSTINYKDGLAITGKGPILKKFPMIPGLDFSGVVEETTHRNLKKGDEVILNGNGVGEKYFGGFSQKARVNGDWLIKLPKPITLSESMSIGSAGLTSMLCVSEIQKQMQPSDGKVLVTGASGGVGSIAVMLLSKLGYHVVASTGKADEGNFLKLLGAKEIIDRKFFDSNEKLLGHQEWKGAIDVVGSKTLAKILTRIFYGGIVIACGLAQGSDLPTNMMPFIIRAITLKGVESIYTDKEEKVAAWNNLSKYINRELLKKLSTTIKFSEIEIYCKKIINAKVKGRIVVDLNSF